MADFETPSTEEKHELMVIDYRARFPGANVSTLSDNWKRTRVTALAVSSLHAHINQVFANLFVTTARGVWLDRIGAVYNLTRKAATVSKGTDVLRVTGTPASAILSGEQLTHDDGTRYQVNENETVPAGGFVDVDVISIDTGTKTLKQTGELLTFVSPPAGINAVAELQSGLDEGGADREQDGVYRQRIIDRIAQPSMGGSAEDYRQWALEVSGIVDAYVYSGRNGLGSVDIVVLKAGEGEIRGPSLAEIAIVQAYIDARRPVSVADFRVLEGVGQQQDVTVTVEESSPDFAFDWDDSTPLVVSTWTAGTLTLKFATSRPADMAIGDRIIPDTALGDAAESTIEDFGAAADEVILSEAPASPPLPSDNVYSGGPLVEPTRVAIKALIDSLGPGRDQYAALPWVGTLTLSDLFKTVQLRDGVLDSAIVLPVANVTPTNTPPNPTINVLTPGRVLVRRT